MSRRRTVLTSVALAAAVAAATAGSAAAQGLDIVAGGLSNPRGMTFGPGGHLYVAESGRGGDGACISGPEGEQQCYGATGEITRINVANGRERRLVGGLPSVAPQEGEAAGAGATGPNDVSFRGRRAYFVVGLGADPAARDQLGRPARAMAALWRHDRSARRELRRVADLGRYEARANPDASLGGGADSNPYSLDAHGRRILVTDAGGNDLLSVGRRGGIRLRTVFPGGTAPAPRGIPNLPEGTPIPYQAVPTGVVRGAGAVAYVGQLTGFPFPVGGANVFRAAGTAAPTVEAAGFTNVVDVARGADGSLYVLQLTSTGLAGPPSRGRLFRVAPDGERTELAAGELRQPTGLAISARGTVYVAVEGLSPDEGQIVRIPG